MVHIFYFSLARSSLVQTLIHASLWNTTKKSQFPLNNQLNWLASLFSVSFFILKNTLNILKHSIAHKEKEEKNCRQTFFLSRKSQKNVIKLFRIRLNMSRHVMNHIVATNNRWNKHFFSRRINEWKVFNNEHRN